MVGVILIVALDPKVTSQPSESQCYVGAVQKVSTSFISAVSSPIYVQIAIA